MLATFILLSITMQNYSRPLDTNKVVEDFLRLSLQFNYTKDPKLKNIVPGIVDGELGVSKFNAGFKPCP